MQNEEMQEIEALISKGAEIKEKKTRIRAQAKEETTTKRANIAEFEKKLKKLDGNQQIGEINEEYEQRKAIY